MSKKHSFHVLERNDSHSHWSDVLLVGGAHHEVSNEQLSRRRVLLFSAVVFLMMLGLFLQLFTIQVLSVDRYVSQANTNRIREIISYAPRGKIYDRNGQVLADNTLNFEISVTPFATNEDAANRVEDAQMVAQITNQPVKQVLEILSSKGKEYSLPLPVAEDISHQQALVMESRLPELEGYSINEVPVRHYDSRSGIAHVVGYSGRASEADLEEYGDDLLPTDYVGKIGIEKSYDAELRGTNGWKKVEVDALGRPVRVLEEQPPTPGEDIYLSIDMTVQDTLAAAIQEQMQTAHSQRASGLVVNPQDGQVLAMVSIPYFDNNAFAQGIDQATFSAWVNDSNQPLYNKVVSGGYTSGSIIKPLVASAALQEGVVNENTRITDSGYINVVGQYGGTFRFNGWNPAGLGSLDIRGAIAMSSNIYFYTVGGGHGPIKGLGEERLTRYYRLFGLGEKTGIDLPNEIDGRVPDHEWKLANKGEPWYVGDSYNISIGQGDLVISPLQITMAEVAITNNGYLLEPHLIKDQPRTVRREIPVNKDYLQIVREGMKRVIGGTTCTCTFANVPVPVAGKSGTAETNTPGGRPPHAWYTAFAPYDDPQFSATVLLEEGVGGSQYAAPAIAKTMESYFKR